MRFISSGIGYEKKDPLEETPGCHCPGQRECARDRLGYVTFWLKVLRTEYFLQRLCALGSGSAAQFQPGGPLACLARLT